jgi:hypothetical protein
MLETKKVLIVPKKKEFGGPSTKNSETNNHFNFFVI